MTREVAIELLSKYKQESEEDYWVKRAEALGMAIEALQTEITWITGNNNAQVAVKNMPVDKMQKICEIIGDEQTNDYKEGYEACKRIMAREEQFKSYCPKCMGKLEPCEDAVSRRAVIDIIHHYKNDRDSQLSDLSDGVCNLPSVNPILKESSENFNNDTNDKSMLNEDLISRQAVLDTIDSYIAHHMGLLDLKLYVTELPSVNPPKVGRWIPMHHSFEGVSESYFVHQYMCSECRALSYFRRDSGAKASRLP